MASVAFHKVAALVLLTCLIGTTEAFYALFSKSKNPQTDHTHATMSHQALLKVVAKYLEGKPRPGSSVQPGDLQNLDPLTSSSLCTAYYGDGQVSAIPLEDAISQMIVGNIYVDFYEYTPEPHMNAEKFKRGNRRLQDTRDVIIKLLRDPDPDYFLARTLIGEYLHIIQDFYSNTNWIEMKGPLAYEDLGLSGIGILPIAKRNEDTCNDCNENVPGNCNNNLIIGEDILTSGYKSGQGTKKPKGNNGKGKCSHGGLYDYTSITTAIGGINKESYDPLLSPHNHLHHDAAVSAMKATENFFLAYESTCDCSGWKCKVRKDFIREREGGVITEGYVPTDSSGQALGQSGVTIGSGVDLGSKTRKYFSDIGVPEGVISKLEPYFGLKKQDAIDKLTEMPLSLTLSEAEDLSNRVEDTEITDVAQLYDDAVLGIGRQAA